MAKNPKKKKQLVDKQIELIDKQIKAVPRILTNIQMQNLILEREKLILSKEDTQQHKENTQQNKEESSGVTPTMGLKAMGAAAAFGGDVEMTAATSLLVAGIGKKIFGGLFKKKEDKDVDTQKDAGSPEKKESKNDNYTDNSVIISILNKILNAFENDNERMRRSIRDAAEKKLESDPTPDTPGAPVKEGDDDKKSGMNKLLMFGAIAGLLIAAYKFKDEIAEILRPITDTLGITNPLKESDKEDYEFDIMDALGVTSLLGMLGIAGAAAGAGGAGARAGGAGAGAQGGAERTNAGSNTRPRHPAGTVIDGKKVGGQFMKVEKATITGIIKAHIGGVAGKILPGVGLALGLWDGFDRMSKGDFNGAAISLGGGVAGVFPGVGTAVSIAAVATNMVRDVYNEAYGVFPEQDESGEKTKRAKEILDEIVQTMTGHKHTPMTAEQKEKVQVELQGYANVAKSSNMRLRQGARSRLIKAGEKAGISKDAIETELAMMRDEATGELTGAQSKNAKDLLDLKESSAAASAASAAASSVPSAAGTDGAAGGAPSAAGGAPSAAGAGGVPSVAGAGGAPSAAGTGAPTGTGEAKGDKPVGAPVPSAPPPSSQTSGSAITSATMESSAAQNTITVLPPIINNETNTSSSNPARESKANKITMQIRMDDEMFRAAVNATAAVLKTLKAA